jgi:hypothetical protein
VAQRNLRAPTCASWFVLELVSSTARLIPKH